MKYHTLIPLLFVTCQSFSAESLPPEQGLSLSQSVALAQEHNPDAAIARSHIAESEILLLRAQAGQQPIVQSSIAYTRMDQPMMAFGSILNQQAFDSSIDFNDTPEIDNLRVGIEARYALYDGGQSSAAQAAAQAGIRAAQAGLESVQLLLTRATSASWIASYKAQAHEQAAEAMITALKAHLRTMQSRQENGTALETDVLELDVRLAEAQDQLIQAQGHTQLAQAALQRLLATDHAPQITDTLPEIHRPQTETTSSQQRPELRSQQERSAAATAQQETAAAQLRPQVQIFGGTWYDHGFETDDGAQSWLAGVQVQYTLWDGNANRAASAAAQQRLQQSKHRERLVALQIDEDIHAARIREEAAQQRISTAQKALTMAGKHRDLLSKRLTAGLATPSQIIDAESSRTAATARLRTAQADLIQARIDWHLALGHSPFTPKK